MCIYIAGEGSIGWRIRAKTEETYLRPTARATMSRELVFGECGKFPPSMYCHANALCYLHRLLTMQPGRIVKSVFNSLHNLNYQGFPSWVSRSYDLAESYQIDMESCIELSPYQFKAASWSSGRVQDSGLGSRSSPEFNTLPVRLLVVPLSKALHAALLLSTQEQIGYL